MEEETFICHRCNRSLWTQFILDKHLEHCEAVRIVPRSPIKVKGKETPPLSNNINLKLAREALAKADKLHDSDTINIEINKAMAHALIALVERLLEDDNDEEDN